MRRFLTFFKRTPSTIKNPETVEIIVKQGNETLTINNVEYAKSLRDDGEVKKVAGKSVDASIDYSLEFIG